MDLERERQRLGEEAASDTERELAQAEKLSKEAKKQYEQYQDQLDKGYNKPI